MIAVSFVILSSTCTTEEAALRKECAPLESSGGRAGLLSALPSESWAGGHGNATGETLNTLSSPRSSKKYYQELNDEE